MPWAHTQIGSAGSFTAGVAAAYEAMIRKGKWSGPYPNIIVMAGDGSASDIGLGSISGAFLASYLSVVDPAQFTFSFSIFILAMVVVGGLGSIWGVVLGALILTFIDSYLLPDVLYDIPGKLGLISARADQLDHLTAKLG